MATQTTQVPVLIVGAGVGGFATSALLAQHGARSLLVEKRPEVFLYPKARNLSFRSLEILRGLGFGDQVHAVADGVSTMMLKPTLNSTQEQPAIDIDAIFAASPASAQNRPAQYCPQSRLEPILLDDTRRRGSEVHYGTEARVRSIRTDAGVTVVVRQPRLGAGPHRPRRLPCRGRRCAQPESETRLGIDHVRLRRFADIRCVHLLPRRRGRSSSRTCPTATLCKSRTPTSDGIFLVVDGRPGHVHHHVLSGKGRNGRPIHAATLPRVAHQRDR